MIDNALKTILSKENYKRIKERKNKEYYLGIYHKLGRDKEKFNKVIQILLDGDEFTRDIDKAIELHKMAIKKLKRIKMGYVLNLEVQKWMKWMLRNTMLKKQENLECQNKLQ